MLRILALLLSWGVLVISNPFLIAIVFGHVLILLTYILASISKFLAFILFIVYVGGVIVLLSYCVILLPFTKYPSYTSLLILPLFIFLLTSIYGNQNLVSAFSYGLLYCVNVIHLASLLLFLVILAIVSIIDYSGGILKLYVESHSISNTNYLLW